MGNKLSCSCAPLIKKAYRYEDTPFQQQRRRDGHLLRLWAEVFHVSAASGAVRWQQISEDLVPVNITCIQDSPECVFHITAYNSQVEKILDVRLAQPGTRLGQASECFVYWKDIATGDTWGLNFTSPLDAKQFRELCSPTFKISRKASSSYSLRLNEPPSKKQSAEKASGKRKPQSTPSSPSRRGGYASEELQCTCMAADTLHKQRNGRVRYVATLPKTAFRQDASGYLVAYQPGAAMHATAGAQQRGQSRTGLSAQEKAQGAHSQVASAAYIRTAQNSRAQYAQSVRKDQARSVDSEPRLRRVQAETSAEVNRSVAQRGTGTTSASIATNTDVKNRSKSSDDVRRTVATATDDLQLDSNTLKKMLHPLSGNQVSPESATTTAKTMTTGTNTMTSQIGELRRESMRAMIRPTSVPSWSYSQSSDTDAEMRSRFYRSEEGRRRSLERTPCVDFTDQSPPSDHYLSDTQNRCYATTPTPSSSGDEGPPLAHKISKLNQSLQRGDDRRSAKERANSPTIKILQEYEQHLRNSLAKGSEDTYSLNTFENLLSQSMENVVALMREVQSELDAIRREEQQLDQIPQRPGGRPYWARSHTLPSRGVSLPPLTIPTGSSTSDLYSAIKKSAPILDSLSIDGSLPFMSTLGIHPQASFESTDSKAYLTSSEMSDDERLSLTTAISDDDDGELRDSPYRAKSGSAAAAFQCTGAVRKAGFLSVKKWLLRKRHQVELARKRGWKGYWVCLKGTTLLFYPCDSRDGRAIESKPRHLIIIDGAIMQPIPEHPKRDFIFCLSTTFGDAYLFQAPCQVELENWIAAIHNSCGAAFARHRGKTGTLHLLQEEIHRMDQQIESDSKLKHMSELQLTVVADIESRKQLQDQIKSYEESIEQFHCEQFRLRCYMASIQGTELPNPKTLLAHVSKPTKAVLNRLGVFTVSSFHAYICARSPAAMLTNMISARGGTRRRGPQVVTGAGSSGSTRSLSRHSSLSSRPGSAGLSRSAELPSDKLLQLMLPPDDQMHSIHVRGSETVEDLLWMALTDKQISPNDYFVRVKRVNGEFYVPPRHEVIDHLPVHDYVQICAKVLYQVELSRHSVDQLFGFSVEAELVENSTDRHNQDELCVYVSRVEEKSLASQQGLAKGDEIMVINGAIVSDLDMMYIESVLQEELSLCMMLRSCRTEPPELCSTVRSTDEYIESLVCPPPPSDGHITDEMIGKLIVPSPLWVQERNRMNAAAVTQPVVKPAQGAMGSTGTMPLPVSGEQIAETLLKTAEQVTSEYCRLTASQQQQQQQQHAHHQPAHHPLQDQQPPQQSHVYIPHQQTLPRHSADGAHHSRPPIIAQQSMDESDQPVITRRPPLSDADKLRKVIRELVDTERTYVEHLNNLLEIYLEPMKKQSLASNQDIHTLFGNIQEIVHFQRTFLDSLQDCVSNEGEAFDRFRVPPEFRNVLFSLGNCFLLYADKFKLYSSFCASHSKASKILHPSNESAQNPALIEFLNSRSRGQHAFSLESYLIKPIQRILKYPLLLQQLKHLTDSNSEEHKHLSQALKGMERVAEHINEMQRIHEEYGAIFDHLQRQHLKSNKTLIELSPVELLYYGGVDWMNIAEFLGKIKKGIDLHTMCFVFKMAVVFLCKERIRQKKKLVGVSNKVSEVEIIRYQVLIPVTEVQVRATSARNEANAVEDASTTHFFWELIHLRCTQMSGGTQRRTEKVYQLSNSTNEFRNCFLRTIRQIIRESVRNMAVPTTKPAILTKPSVHQTTSASSAQTTTVSSLTTVTSVSSNNQSQPQPIASTSQGSQSKDTTPQSQSSSSSTQLTKSSDKPALKQKPLPPPRAPTTTKSNMIQTLQQQSSKESDHVHHGKHTVSCGLCGADVGLGPGETAAKSSLRSSPQPDTDKSDPSTSSGAARAKLIASRRETESEERQESQDENNASPIWKPRDSNR